MLVKLGRGDVVGNDTFLSNATRLVVVTGPNMSGSLHWTPNLLCTLCITCN